jgi:hypothetical protein
MGWIEFKVKFKDTGNICVFITEYIRSVFQRQRQIFSSYFAAAMEPC